MILSRFQESIRTHGERRRLASCSVVQTVKISWYFSENRSGTCTLGRKTLCITYMTTKRPHLETCHRKHTPECTRSGKAQRCVLRNSAGRLPPAGHQQSTHAKVKTPKLQNPGGQATCTSHTRMNLGSVWLVGSVCPIGIWIFGFHGHVRDKKKKKKKDKTLKKEHAWKLKPFGKLN